MKKILFSQAHFIMSALDPKEFPRLHNPSGKLMTEIAFVGRSNVGKSSLLNHLMGNKKLAKTSSVPGKTQTLNFFAVDTDLVLVDLPGYGYARTPKHLKEKWSGALDIYLREREQLKLILLLLDGRREPSEEDLVFVDWAIFHQKPLILIFTKSDKLSPHETTKNMGQALKAISDKNPEIDVKKIPFISYSVKDAFCRARLIESINQNL